MSTKQQLADIFTKPLDEQRFCALRSELNILDSRNLAWPVAHLWLMPRLGKTILFEWVLWKSWILIFGSNLDSCDYCYVLLFVPSHTWIKMSYMSTSNFHPILRSQNSLQNNFFWAVFQLIGTSDPWSELPIHDRNFRQGSEVSGYFRPDPLGRPKIIHRNFRWCVGCSNPAHRKSQVSSDKMLSGKSC